jgi:hypothetical protein
MLEDDCLGFFFQKDMGCCRMFFIPYLFEVEGNSVPNGSIFWFLYFQSFQESLATIQAEKACSSPFKPFRIFD